MGTHELSVQFNCHPYVFVIIIWAGTLARPYLKLRINAKSAPLGKVILLERFPKVISFGRLNPVQNDIPFVLSFLLIPSFLNSNQCFGVPKYPLPYILYWSSQWLYA